MTLSAERKGICAILILGAGVILYYATLKTPGSSRPIPATQRESQVMGLNVRAGITYGTPGSPLDMSAMHDLHFWAPGWSNTGTTVDDHPVVVTPHRYPAIPGGNLSTVMHKGWSSLMDSSPAMNDWFRNPPEVAIL